MLMLRWRCNKSCSSRFFGKRKRTSYSEVLFIIWHRAIFPGLDGPSIVTATRLNCCVRDGNRCFPRAMGTKIALWDTCFAGFSSRGSGEINSPIRLLFPVRDKQKPIDVHDYKISRISKLLRRLIKQTGEWYSPITSQCTCMINMLCSLNCAFECRINFLDEKRKAVVWKYYCCVSQSKNCILCQK